ncbi:hypothetical protein L6472_05915 [Prevotella sp. E13-17]|uniref:hypothetical protein n=1 Tax=Prevotella sp. E13-17 TaxID=2913616 RepID=UPI001EDB9809|nr:hypothetical protein [Prevotella sp. E13-17]UKK52113.1 hypothetical protein L6472_05915 [Prevotella sp. E13-17]
MEDVNMEYQEIIKQMEEGTLERVKRDWEQTEASRKDKERRLHPGLLAQLDVSKDWQSVMEKVVNEMAQEQEVLSILLILELAIKNDLTIKQACSMFCVEYTDDMSQLFKQSTNLSISCTMGLRVRPEPLYIPKEEWDKVAQHMIEILRLRLLKKASRNTMV